VSLLYVYLVYKRSPNHKQVLICQQSTCYSTSCACQFYFINMHR